MLTNRNSKLKCVRISPTMFSTRQITDFQDFSTTRGQTCHYQNVLARDQRFVCHGFDQKSSFSQIRSTRSTTIRQQTPTTTSAHQILTTTNEHQISTMTNVKIPTTIHKHLTPTKPKLHQLQPIVITTMMLATINTKFDWLARLSSQSPTTSRYQILTVTNGW